MVKPFDLFEYLYMPFELKTAMIFERFINNVFLSVTCVFVHMKYTIVFSETTALRRFFKKKV